VHIKQQQQQQQQQLAAAAAAAATAGVCSQKSASYPSQLIRTALPFWGQITWN